MIKCNNIILIIIIIIITLLIGCNSGSDNSDTISNSEGDSILSNPSGIAATSANQSVTIIWNSVAGADSYNLYWSTSAGGNSKVIRNLISSSYQHIGRTNGVEYFYTVTAVNSSGESLPSLEVSATPSSIDPPSGVIANPGNELVRLNWEPVNDATSYNLYFSASSGSSTNSKLITNVASPYNHEGLTNGTDYYYVLTAVNQFGESVASVEVNATPTTNVQVSSLRFADPNLAACVNDSLLASGLVSDMTTLECPNRSITNIVSIGSLTALTYLSFHSTYGLGAEENIITDLRPLSSLVNLIFLDLTANRLTETDISPLSTLSNLQTLELDLNNINDLDGLNGLTKLSSLALNDNNIIDIYPLARFVSLETLFLDRNNISDITGLTSLRNLLTLYISGNNIDDLTGIENLSNLMNLSLQNNNIGNPSPIFGLTTLRFLVLGENNITSLAGIEALTNLDGLYLASNRISKINSLSSLYNLVSLDLSHNSIDSITPLLGLTNLQLLGLVNNNITDVSGIANLSALFTLDLMQNAIIDVSPIAALTSLRRVTLVLNNIGGQGIGNVDSLVALTNATYIGLEQNINMSCNELVTLESALGASIVALTPTDGVNCTNP